MSVLSRYLDPEVLSQIADRPFEPRGLVLGNLAGGHKSPQSGFAVEFHGHREYVPGDDPRHIDWRVYYLRDKYFVKQYEMETNFVCHLLLDVSASMRYGEGRGRSCCTRPKGDGAGILYFAPERQSVSWHVRSTGSRIPGSQQFAAADCEDDGSSGPDRGGEEDGRFGQSR